MFGIDTEKWFSFFRRGVELLADMSTKYQFSDQQVPTSRPKRFGSQKKIPYSRAIAIRKAKAALRSSLYGGGKPRHGTFEWAGHCVTNRTGHGVPSFEQNMSHFGESMARFFFPHSCSGALASQAMVASKWLQQTENWQGMPWYGPIMGQCNVFREQTVARQQTHWQNQGPAAAQKNAHKGLISKD